MKGINTNTIAIIVLREFGTGECQAKRTNTNFIVRYQVVWPLDRLAVHVDTVSAICIHDTVAPAHLLKTSMMARDLRVIEHDRITGIASNLDGLCIELNRWQLWQCLLHLTASIIICQCDECTVFVTYTKDISASERFPKWFIASK